ncbi:unnamed protein product [Zymoseptoria tritici ST99CH_1A5]|uniref:Heterokaryon incompatibility domain-containing protein n=1 Tax=Zymoseptoria tritici ST99CH_1A5 TaxID=1276529 RepID=A0A1Y6LDZ4_ZYMTR|nr:unnamed protein product [Zymoseptoria tritici ST99CH_1A5]
MDATQLSPSRFNPPAPVFLPSELYPEPLDAEKHEIRLLLTLLPGAFHEPIQCTLAKICLKDTERPVYEALSYVWGDPKITKYVMVHGALFPVTMNLESALRHLRDKNDPRTLWIDAICINQNVTDGREDKERHGQVRMMGQVYTIATRVIIWLGAGDKTVVHAIKSLQAIVASEAETIPTGGVLDKVTCLDWFHRVWTKQEMALAVDDPILIYGQCMIPWSLLLSASRVVLNETPNAHSALPERTIESAVGISTALYGARLVLTLSELSRRQRSKNACTLRMAIWCGKFCRATNPRDMIYGVFGMWRAERWTPHFPIDYRLPVHVVFMQAMAYLINVDREITVFQTERLVGPSPAAPELAQTSSWAIDFTAQPRDFENLEITCPGRFSPPYGFSPSGLVGPNHHCFTVLADLQTLKVKVVPVDVIDKVVKFGDDWRDCVNNLTVLEYLAREAERLPLGSGDLPQKLTGLRSSQPLWRVLIEDSVGFVRKENLYGRIRAAPPKFEAMYNAMIKLCRQGRIFEAWEESSEYAHCLKERCGNKAFFTTRCGFIGTSAGGVQIGDEVSVWLGLQCPMVTRPGNDGSGTCRLVNGAYVGGIMKGEMVDELYLEGLIKEKYLLVR